MKLLSKALKANEEKKKQAFMYYFKGWVFEKAAWELGRLFNEPFGELGFTVYPGIFLLSLYGY